MADAEIFAANLASSCRNRSQSLAGELSRTSCSAGDARLVSSIAELDRLPIHS